MDIEDKFKITLLSQADDDESGYSEQIDKYREMARTFATLQGGIAVLSDFLHDKSYLYSGPFGRTLGLDEKMEIDSAFEDVVFSCIDRQDLLDRHILELRYVELIKSTPSNERKNYIQSSKINVCVNNTTIPIIHQTRYLEITENGNINIGICTYLPVGLKLPEGFDGQIINIATGQPLTSGQLQVVDNMILSPREKEILSMLSKGMSSKQIASSLNLSPNTVYRHRQNILSHLNVANTAEAVRIGLKMKLV